MGTQIMIEKNAITIAGKTFEGLKLVNEHGAEYWSARTLQTLLGYSQWRRFGQAIERAMISCQESGNLPGHHGAGKPIAGARKRDWGRKGAMQIVDDDPLSRFACYLIARNGNPRKPEMAHEQIGCEVRDAIERIDEPFQKTYRL